MIKLAINGFGRIGRQAFKIAFDRDDVEIVAINDLSNARALAHLLIYDSVYGEYDRSVKILEDGNEIDFDDDTVPMSFDQTDAKEVFLVVDGHKVQVFAQKDPAQLPWGQYDVDVVLECTGFFTKDGAAKAHLDAGAKRVVVSAPTSGGNVQTFLKGVNHDKYAGEAIISNASCTTNCVSPVTAVIEQAFGIKKAMMTTVHAVTVNQELVDSVPGGPKADMRRSRSGMVNIVPTSTGAAEATAEVFPHLAGKFDGLAIRVPVITGSLSDFTLVVEKPTTVEEVNEAFLEASKNPFYEGVLAVTYAPLVSTDIIGSSYSAIVDLSLTHVVDGDLVKVLAWYDNEWGYSNRLVEMAVEVSKQN